MRVPRPVLLPLLVTVVVLHGPPDGRAGDAPAELGGTYTAAELEALDRALDAANLTREDLRFDKDLAGGIGCLPRVRALLGDPLAIAPTMDELAGRLAPGDGTALDPRAALAIARDLLEATGTGTAGAPPVPGDVDAALA